MKAEKLRHALLTAFTKGIVLNQDYYDELMEELYALERADEELEAKAAKWDDPNTRSDLELAAAVKLAIENDLVIKKYGNGIWVTSPIGKYPTLLITWYREQKRGAE